MPLSTVRSFLTRSVTNATLEKGAQTAIKLFHEAAERVPAYKDFLKKNGIDHRSIRTARDFAKIPVTDKPSYMNAYSLPELSWDGDFTTASCVSTSSGSTGVPFYWPRARRHDAAINTMIQHKFEDIFDTKSGTTLAVDSFALGQWIAGLEFYNAIKWTAERGSKITVITPGIDKVEAVREIEKLAPYYDRVVIGGYPPFIKDIIDQGSISGINWSTIDLRILAGGEAVSDIWKDRLL